MADFVFDVAKGRTTELVTRVNANDPANSAIIIVAINTTALDTTLKGYATLQAVLDDANTIQVTNAGYSRRVLTDTSSMTITVDTQAHRVDVDMPDQTFSAIAAGTVWTDLLLCYDSDTTSGTDTNIIPLVQLDFPVTPDGGNIIVQFSSGGFYRAA